jgi:hypothetical protein
MTTNQTPEAGSVAKLAEARVLQSWCEARLGDSEWGHFMQQHFQRIAKCIGDLAALAEQGQRDSERLRAALILAREELDGLPRSLGYGFTQLPKIDAALNPEKTA